MAFLAPIAAFASANAGVISLIGTAISAFSTMQQGSQAEEAAKAQQAVYDMQARNTQVVAERNALIREDEAEYNAARLEEEAGSTKAAGIRKSKEIRRLTDLKASAARARQGVGDPTSLSIIGDITGDGEFNALTALYEGNSAASLLRSQAGLTRFTGGQDAQMIRYGGTSRADLLRYEGEVTAFKGEQAKSSSLAKAGGQLFSGVTSVASKYPPKPKLIDPIIWNT